MKKECVNNEKEKINDLLGYEGLKIIQRPDAFNFSLDSTLLADFVTIGKKDKKIVDLGCGNGYIPIFLTLRTKEKIQGLRKNATLKKFKTDPETLKKLQMNWGL